MTRDEIMRLAKKAGFTTAEFWPDDYTCLFECVERFAALVAASEREACAQIVESVDNFANPMTANDCAIAIRARGKSK